MGNQTYSSDFFLAFYAHKLYKFAHYHSLNHGDASEDRPAQC